MTFKPLVTSCCQGWKLFLYTKPIYPSPSQLNIALQNFDFQFALRPIVVSWKLPLKPTVCSIGFLLPHIFPIIHIWFFRFTALFLHCYPIVVICSSISFCSSLTFLIVAALNHSLFNPSFLACLLAPFYYCFLSPNCSIKSCLDILLNCSWKMWTASFCAVSGEWILFLHIL